MMGSLYTQKSPRVLSTKIYERYCAIVGDRVDEKEFFKYSRG